MSESSDKRSAEFLAISDQFKLGALVTESSHPVTAKLSEVSIKDAADGLRLLFEADRDVLRKYRGIVESGRLPAIAEVVLRTVESGGKIFFTGCGSTGRLSIQLVSIWRDFWQQVRQRGGAVAALADSMEQRALSVMAGGDFALIKAVEGFEDYTAFGRKQIRDLGVSAGDAVFAITEGGETSFVIGTAWEGLDQGAKVYFVYNNPDGILCEHVQRSREIIQEARIEKINVTTGPMAITGSTRMQATTVQLCVMVTVLEMVVQSLLDDTEGGDDSNPRPEAIPARFLESLEAMHATLQSIDVRKDAARLVELEESVYRSGHRNNYFADSFGIDLLTDTTERSPTFCIPAFRKFDDTLASESWAFLFVPDAATPEAWRRLLRREPKCIEWNAPEVHALVSPDKVERTLETVRRISVAELMRFRIGQDGLAARPSREGDSAVVVAGPRDGAWFKQDNAFFRQRLESATSAGARVGLLQLGGPAALEAVKNWAAEQGTLAATALVPVPHTGFLLDGVTRVGLKMLLNAISTSIMVRLGRVMGNYMIYVVPSNLKLIDRATRYISQIAGLDYVVANRLLFEVIEYVEPRMRSDRAYPPVVGMAVCRARHGIGNAEAETMLSGFSDLYSLGRPC